MEIIFDISKYKNSGITITGNEQYLTSYDWNNYEFGNYMYKDCISINILIPLDSKGNEGDYTIVINDHSEHKDESIIEFFNDGLYKIIRIILPIKKWFDQYTINNLDLNNIYYYDSKQFFNGFGEVISIKDIIEYNININSKLIFSSNNLQDCFYNNSNVLLQNYCENKRCFDNKLPKEFEIIWIGIHVIKYLLDLNRFFEAQYVLEKLTRCSGLCKNEIKRYGCNC